VTVTGANLADATRVEFGGVEASITAQDDDTVTVTTPEHEAGEVTVVVTSPAGESADSEAARYTYLPAVVPPPVVTGIEPGLGPTGGGQRVTIRGTGLAGATAVNFGGVVVRDFLADTDTAVVLATPAHDAGYAGVAVVTPGGASKVVTYLFADPPMVSSLVPGSTCVEYDSTEVVVHGSGFTGPDGPWVQQVRFGDRTVAVHSVSADTITVTAPAQPGGTVDVTVSTPAGTSAARSFEYENCVE
jgi:hypothetical protein